MSYQETLREIGFNDKEIKIYLALLKNGRATPAALSKITKINRATVYSSAKELLNKGVIAEDLAGKNLFLIALPPKNLGQTVEKIKRELKEKEELVKKAVGELSLITAGHNYPVPKIRFVEENNLKNYLYDNGVRWIKEALKSDGTWWGFQDHSLVENYHDWILWLWDRKEYQDPHYRAQLLSNQSDIEEKMGKRLSRNKRDIRFIDRMNFTSSIWVVGNCLIMVFTQHHPFYLVEINDKAIAHNMREVFRKMWNLTL